MKGIESVSMTKVTKGTQTQHAHPSPIQQIGKLKITTTIRRRRRITPAVAPVVIIVVVVLLFVGSLPSLMMMMMMTVVSARMVTVMVIVVETFVGVAVSVIATASRRSTKQTKPTTKQNIENQNAQNHLEKIPHVFGLVVIPTHHLHPLEFDLVYPCQ